VKLLLLVPAQSINELLTMLAQFFNDVYTADA